MLNKRYKFSVITSAVGGCILSLAGVRFALRGDRMPAVLAITAGLLMLFSAWGYSVAGKKLDSEPDDSRVNKT